MSIPNQLTKLSDGVVKAGNAITLLNLFVTLYYLRAFFGIPIKKTGKWTFSFCVTTFFLHVLNLILTLVVMSDAFKVSYKNLEVCCNMFNLVKSGNICLSVAPIYVFLWYQQYQLHKRIPVRNKGFCITGIALLLVLIVVELFVVSTMLSKYDAIGGVGCVRVDGLSLSHDAFKFRMTVLAVFNFAGCSLTWKLYMLLTNERRNMTASPHFKTSSKLCRDIKVMIVSLIVCVLTDSCAILAPYLLPHTWPLYPTNVAYDIVVLVHSLMLAISTGVVPKTCCRTFRRVVNGRLLRVTARVQSRGGGDVNDDGV